MVMTTLFQWKCGNIIVSQSVLSDSDSISDDDSSSISDHSESDSSAFAALVDGKFSLLLFILFGRGFKRFQLYDKDVILPA